MLYAVLSTTHKTLKY